MIEFDLALPMVVLLSYLRRHWGQRGHCNGVVEEVVKGGLVYHQDKRPGSLEGRGLQCFSHGEGCGAYVENE